MSERRSGEGAPDATRDGKDSSLRGDFERTLGANSVGEGRPARSEGAIACETRACDGQMSITDFMGSGISAEDATVALREIPSDVCFTAAALMARALRVMDENPQVKEMHIPFESAVRCATLNPAKSIGIDDKYGSLEEGKYANAVVLDKDLNIVSIIQKGQVK